MAEIKTVLSKEQIEKLFLKEMGCDGGWVLYEITPGNAIQFARAIEAAVLSANAGKVDAEPEACWQDMTDYGQVKAGDFISFFIGDTHYDERVKEVLDAGTDREELIYNNKKNFYVISKNVLTGFGNVTKFRFFGKQAIDAGKVCN